MKNLTMQKWRQAYLGIFPTYYQRYWVQLLFEILDPDTDYSYDLGLSDIIALLDELQRTPTEIKIKGRKKPISNGRTLFFLLSEIDHRLSNDVAFDYLLNDAHLAGELKTKIKCLTASGRELFAYDGARLENPQTDYGGWVKNLDAFRCSDLTPVIESFRRKNCTEMYASILRNKLDADHLHGDHIFEAEIDNLTHGLLFHLVNREKFSSSYLIGNALDVFLRRSSEPFASRFNNYFRALGSGKRCFQVFFRLQAKKELRQIRQIDRVAVMEQVPDMVALVDQLAQKGKINRSEIKPAKEFFYNGEKSDRMIFGVVSDLETGDPGQAIVMAFFALNNALHQAKFEFELSTFSLDNNIYIYDLTQEKLMPFTRRQALSRLYGRKGNPERLEQILWKIELARKNEDSDQVIIDKVSSLALQWHHHAMDAISPEVRYMNHWIALEQIFKSVNDEHETSGDDLVLGLASALQHHQFEGLRANLWGDLTRCDFMGTKPLVSHHGGKIEFTKYLYERVDPKTGIVEPPTKKFYFPDNQRPIDIIIHSFDSGIKKGYRIDDGFQIFVKDGQTIPIGGWIAGMPIVDDTKDPSGILQELFEGCRPPLMNIVYLWRCHSAYMAKAFGLHADSPDYRDLVSCSKQLQPDIISGYREVENLLVDLVKIIPFEELQIKDFQNTDALFPSASVVEQAIGIWKSWHQILKTKGWPSGVGVDGRLQALQIQENKLKESIEPYKVIAVFRDRLTRSIDGSGWESPGLSDSLIRELYRGSTPNWDALHRILLTPKKVTELVKISPEQPLLCSRIQQVADKLSTKQNENIFIWDLDRMRRIRNELVHTAQADETIDLIARRLYQWSRIYLTKVLNRLAFTDKKSSLDILFWEKLT